MTELADRLSRHADLHEHQPWADDEQMQFARDLREAVGLIAELARLRAVEPWDRGVFKGADGLRKLLDSQPYWDEQSYGTRLYFGPNINDYLHRDVLRAAVEYLERAAPPAQPANIDAAFDAAAQALLERGRAQPAEPVQRLSDAGIEALAGKHGTTYRNRHFPTQPAFSFSNGSLHRFVRDIESALQTKATPKGGA